jgi:D-arabinose 1-dehydrogenase-like Zn-dependent alcohol dehydrogenase
MKPAQRLSLSFAHEIVGRIDAIGAGVEGLSLGERVGVPNQALADLRAGRFEGAAVLTV